jgi:hypothetical protein
MLRHEGVWRSECIDPHVLDLDTSWRWVVSFTPRPGTHWMGGWVDPRAGLDDVEKRKFWTLLRLELRLLGCPAHSQSLYQVCYPSSWTSHSIYLILQLVTEMSQYTNDADWKLAVVPFFMLSKFYKLWNGLAFQLCSVRILYSISPVGESQVFLKPTNFLPTLPLYSNFSAICSESRLSDC